MNQKTVLITGANSGIGFETAKSLASKGFHLILIVRSKEKANEVTNEILKTQPNVQIDTFLGDLNNLESIKNVAKEIGSKYKVIDRIICNAGFGPDKVEFHANGLEQSFVTNHLGHFALVNQLLPQVETAIDGRVINVASSVFKMGKMERMFVKNNTKMNALQAYGDSKLANVLFTKALAKKLKNATTYSLHPGVVNSNFGKNYTGFFKFMSFFIRPFMITPEKGAQTSIYLATTPLENIKLDNGGYFETSKSVKITSSEVTEENATWLWNKSLEVL